MLYPPLTPVVMLQQLVRLNDTWPRWEADDEQFKRMSRSYHEALNDLDAEAVAGGVGIWLRTSTSNRWPSPAQIREAAMRWVTANRDLRVLRRDDDDEVACKICRAVPRWAELQARDYRTGKTGTVVRMIAPCDEAKHPDHSPYTPLPDNFIRWATIDTTTHDDEHAYARLLQASQGHHRVPAEAGLDVHAHRGQVPHQPPTRPRDLLGSPEESLTLPDEV